MEAKPYRPVVRELASRLYAELIAASAATSLDGPKMTAAAEGLARLSFELAESFQSVEDQLNAANLPKNVGFKLEASDIAEWSK